MNNLRTTITEKEQEFLDADEAYCLTALGKITLRLTQARARARDLEGQLARTNTVVADLCRQRDEIVAKDPAQAALQARVYLLCDEVNDQRRKSDDTISGYEVA